MSFRFLFVVSLAIFVSQSTGIDLVNGCVFLQDVKSSENDTAKPKVLTAEDISKRAESAKSATELDEPARAVIQQLFERAKQHLESAELSQAELNQFNKLAEQSSERLAAAKKLLADPSAADTKLEISRLTEAQLQEMLRQKEVELAESREKAKATSAEMTRRQSRSVEIPELVSKAEKRLAEVAAQLSAEVPVGEAAVFTNARKTLLAAEQQSLQQQLDAINAERKAYTLTADLPPLEDQLAQQKTKRLEAEVATIKAGIAALRESEIQKRIRVARELLERTAAPLKPVAQKNLELAEQLEAASKRIASVTRTTQRTEERRVDLAKRFETTKGRVEAIGLSETLGIMLHQAKDEVERLRNRPPIDPKLNEEVSIIRADSFKSEDFVESLRNPEQVAGDLLSVPEISVEQREELLAPATELLKQQKDAYVRLAELQNDSFHAIFGLLHEQKRFATLCDEYSTYIDEHVLWIRSAPLIGSKPSLEVSHLIAAGRALGDPVTWKNVGLSFIRGIQNRLSTFLVIAFGLLLMFAFHGRLKNNIRRSAKIAEKRSCREMAPTATSFLETILLSFFWPGVIMSAGWLLRADSLAAQFSSALGTGLITVGLVLMPLEFFRHVCRNDGLADAHFDWAESARLSIKKNVRWLTLVGAPLLLITVTYQHLGNDDWNNTLGRISAILLLGLSTLFFYRVLRPGGPLFQDKANRDSQFFRLRYVRFAIFVVGHMALIVFAVAGYYYTTYQMGVNLIQTILVSIGVVTLYNMALRLLMVRRRRLRYEQLMLQREELKKQHKLAVEAKAKGSPSKSAENMEIELQTEVGTDINSVSRQAKELTGVIFLVGVLVCLWQIWQDVLPATKMLDNWELWKVAVGDKGETAAVTLRDLFFSLGLFLLTFFAVRNIPGTLELLLLNKLPLDSGSRYAITSIFRYIITVAGVILALNFLKIPWSNYSWLVAAISVGLGFGLQEIVANFVSGLIILLERPVRVGDIVTIDGTTGFVSRIQMRATTVTNFDNQELVVPNKDLVTGKIMNWTLTSVINRVSLTVGVAYGTDVAKVKRILEEVAAANPDVLNDPLPLVCFEEFGDSSLNFRLRCCVTTIEKRIGIVHALNSAINEAFIREKIVVPFPQRDVHMIQPPSKE